MSDEKNHYKNS